MQHFFLCVLIATVHVELVRINDQRFVEALTRVLDARSKRYLQTHYMPDSEIAPLLRRSYGNDNPSYEVRRNVFVDLENSANDDSEYGMEIDMGPLITNTPKMAEYHPIDDKGDLQQDTTESNIKPWKDIDEINETENKNEYDGIVSDPSEDEYVDKYKYPNVHWHSTKEHKKSHHGKYDMNSKRQRQHQIQDTREKENHHHNEKPHENKTVKHKHWFNNNNLLDKINKTNKIELFSEYNNQHRIDINTDAAFHILHKDESDESWKPNHKSHKVHKKPTGFNMDLGKKQNKLKYHVLTYANLPTNGKLKPKRRTTTPKVRYANYEKKIKNKPTPREYIWIKLRSTKPPTTPSSVRYGNRGFKQNMYIGGPLGIWGKVDLSESTKFTNLYQDDGQDEKRKSYGNSVHPDPNMLLTDSGEQEAGKANAVNNSDPLSSDVRILCIVSINPRDGKMRATQIKNTWGKRCNMLFFSSIFEGPSLPSVGWQYIDGTRVLWNNTRAALNYVYHNHINDADWFLKADDKSYVIMENLRYKLLDYNSQDPVIIGCAMYPGPGVTRRYMHGGAGYVMSKETLSRFVEQGAVVCDTDAHKTMPEDEFIGECLQNLEVEFIEPSDPKGRTYFHPQNIINTLHPSRKIQLWWKVHTQHTVGDGLDCCTDNTISFHNMSMDDMVIAEFLIYHIQAHLDLITGIQKDRIRTNDFNIPFLDDNKPENYNARKIYINIDDKIDNFKSTTMNDESDISDYDEGNSGKKREQEYKPGDGINTKGKWYTNKYLQNLDPTDSEKSELSEFFRESSEESSDGEENKKIIGNKHHNQHTKDSRRSNSNYNRHNEHKHSRHDKERKRDSNIANNSNKKLVCKLVKKQKKGDTIILSESDYPNISTDNHLEWEEVKSTDEDGDEINARYKRICIEY